MKTLITIAAIVLLLATTAIVRHGFAGAGRAYVQSLAKHDLHKCMDASKGYIPGQGIFCMGGIPLFALLGAAFSKADLNDPPHRPTLPLSVRRQGFRDS